MASSIYNSTGCGRSPGFPRQAESQVTRAGTSTAPDLRAGYTFSLSDQTSAGLGGNYLVTAIHHAGFIRVTNGVATCFYAQRISSHPGHADLPGPQLKTRGPAGPTLHGKSGRSAQVTRLTPMNTGRVKSSIPLGPVWTG